MDFIPAVVTPLDSHMGLDIARSLGRRGIQVYGIDTLTDESLPGIHSKYCKFVRSPDPEKENGEAYIQFILEFGKKLTTKAVLYPLSDKHVLLISRHRAELQSYYDFVMPDHETIEKLTTKNGLQCIATQYNIPAPKSIEKIKKNEIEQIAQQITYPAILKPTESTLWHSPQIVKILSNGFINARAKVILCNTPSELIQAYQRVANINDNLIVQEVIPGEDNRLVYFSFYLNRQSRPIGIFAGRKFRVIPVGFGSASYVRSYFDPELVNIGLKLLSATNYQGLGGIEFKKDPRDEHYKLIEFNTRFGMWDGLSVKCGVDLPYISYCDTLNLPIEPKCTYREDMIWVDWQRDVRAASTYIHNGQLTLKQWLHSLQGDKMWAIYSKDDWRPGVYFTLILAYRLIERVIRRLLNRS